MPQLSCKALQQKIRDLEKIASEQAKALEALQKSEKHYKNLVETQSELICRYTADWKLTFVNDAYCRYFGKRREDLIGSRFWGLIPTEDRKMVAQRHRDLLHANQKEAVHEHRVVDKKGSFRWQQWINRVIYDQNGDFIEYQSVGRDITHRKQAEASLEKAKRQWEATFDAISDWVCLIDENHIIVRSNVAAGQFIGQKPGAVVGRHCYELVHGTDCPISDCPLRKALHTRQHESMKFPAGGGRWWRISVDPVENTPGGNGLMVHVVRDITDDMDREKADHDARKADAFSILAGGIAHDYNNLLAVIWGNISLLQEVISDKASMDYINSADKACRQARDLTHQFITLSQSAGVKKNPCDLKTLLDAAVESAAIPETVHVSMTFLPESPPLEADADQLQIVFKNIITNAVEAMPWGGKLNIRIEKKSIAPGRGIRAGYLKIAFRDTGVGIARSDLVKIFDPYFSNKEMGTQKGMGLGLAIARSIVTKHGGDIDIVSDPGQGTALTLFLPLPGSELPTDFVEKRTFLKKPLILLMEDEPALREMCRQMIVLLGYEVLAEGTGTELIERYQENQKNVALILLDQNIKGGFGGIETLEKLRKIGFQNKAVVVSGSPSGPAINDFRKYGFDGQLLKPYVKKELAAVIHNFLPH